MPDGPVELSDTMASSSSTGAGVAAARSMPKYASLVAAVLLISAPLVQRPVLGQSDSDLAPAPVAAPSDGPVPQPAAELALPADAEPESPQPEPEQPARISTGLVTIESDQQRADQLTGVVTATGNVRIVYPDERVVATARQAQYFSKENRVVLSGDVDIVQEGGNLIRAERVVYLVDGERLIAIPPSGQQVFSRLKIQQKPAPQPPPSQPAAVLP
jgi:lipopolysaccharide export system protein LptA